MKSVLLLFVICISLTGCQSNNTHETTNDLQANEEMVPVNHPDTDVALNFINDYVTNCNKMSDAESVVEWVHSNMSVSITFKNELNRIMEEAYEIDPEMGLGFDPIFNAQDYPQEGFELESSDAETGYVTVVGKEWKEFKLTIRMIYDDNEWLVDGCGIVNMPGKTTDG